VKVKIKNDNVLILLSIAPDKNLIELTGLYNKKKIKGIARCSLFVLLQKMLDLKIVKPDTKIMVDDPEPDDPEPEDRNIERLIKNYEEMGFTIEEKPPPVEGSGDYPLSIYLISTVQHLIDTLKQQCEMTGVGSIKHKSKKHRKRKTKKRKNTRRRVSKKNKTRKRRQRKRNKIGGSENFLPAPVGEELERLAVEGKDIKIEAEAGGKDG